MNEKSKRLVNNAIIFMIGNIGSKFIQFFLVPLYTYTLSTEQYGITELVLTATNLLMPVFSISIADGLLRFGLDKNLKKESVLKCAFIITALGTILSVACVPILGFHKTLNDWIWYFLVILNLRIYRDIFSIYLKINEKNRMFAIDSMLFTFELCLASIVFLVWMNMGIEGYFLAYVVANILSIAFLVIAGKPINSIRKSKMDTRVLKDMIQYSIPMVINGVAWWITNASDRFMIEWFMTEADVGIYSVSAKLPAFITTFTGVFNQAWTISAVIEYDNEKEKKFYSETFHRYYFLLFISVACILMILKPFMRVYVSDEFYIAWKYATFLICSTGVSGIAAFTSGMYAATKRNKNVMVTTVIGASINIIFNYIFIPKMGIMGAAIATYMSWLIVAMVRLYDINKNLKFYINYQKVAIYIGITLLQCIIIIYNNILGIIFSCFVISIMVICERELLKNVINQIRGRIINDKKRIFKKEN